TGAPLSPESQKIYESQVKPFLKQHCIKCHDDNKTLGGFRIDILGTDFLEGKTADHWKEIIDNISLGKMPPRKQPRPDPEKAFTVVKWVNQELLNAMERGQSTGGRVAVRRMNRTEWAFTVASLFGLDDKFAREIERELPEDGKIGNFDRGGAALLMDKSLM